MTKSAQSQPCSVAVLSSTDARPVNAACSRVTGGVRETRPLRRALAQRPQRERRAFANISSVPFVGDTEDEDSRFAERDGEPPIEFLFELIDDITRHRQVDFAGKLDEAGRNLIFLCFPGEIKRIDRNARAHTLL